jgi:hypothetical protein
MSPELLAELKAFYAWLVSAEGGTLPSDQILIDAMIDRWRVEREAWIAAEWKRTCG